MVVRSSSPGTAQGRQLLHLIQALRGVGYVPREQAV